MGKWTGYVGPDTTDNPKLKTPRCRTTPKKEIQRNSRLAHKSRVVLDLLLVCPSMDFCPIEFTNLS